MQTCFCDLSRTVRVKYYWLLKIAIKLSLKARSINLLIFIDLYSSADLFISQNQFPRTYKLQGTIIITQRRIHYELYLVAICILRFGYNLFCIIVGQRFFCIIVFVSVVDFY